jgi:hypothetical protein
MNQQQQLSYFQCLVDTRQEKALLLKKDFPPPLIFLRIPFNRMTLAKESWTEKPHHHYNVEPLEIDIPENSINKEFGFKHAR